ncbi:UDP-N-acetylglucosamine 1-carboxyvinyltransferase [Gracilibacillus boraciitolerans JCM 21714]|uniref:UDP-N-acetylglucosamine 1-carboxyvinyltransferase n=1 Tax=Gracilibacillus boraciitolerans JCM 21714 TaxID=1298598 RepID=W4VIE4_9BACI|nr:UDP-N-acetylglucosamine 1-carboxyvinyltransferase [Gracilibacillus boraciitolerans JCM 21714]
MANGITEITGLEHIDRGYANITEKLANLGAKIWREEMTEKEIQQFQNS